MFPSSPPYPPAAGWSGPTAPPSAYPLPVDVSIVGGGAIAHNPMMGGALPPYHHPGYYQPHPHPSGIQWVPMNGGRYPLFAIQAGFDSGRELYVARAYHNGGIIPGKLHVGHNVAYVAYDGQEVPKDGYEILVAPVASLSWIDGQGSYIPPHAVVGGHDPAGEPYYVGRVWLNGTITVGKIHPSHGQCYVPYGGTEHGHSTYEILVRNALGRALNV